MGMRPTVGAAVPGPSGARFPRERGPMQQTTNDLLESPGRCDQEASWGQALPVVPEEDMLSSDPTAEGGSGG